MGPKCTKGVGLICEELKLSCLRGGCLRGEKGLSAVILHRQLDALPV